ncbi:B3 domain-containing protein Os02g0598200-like [Primulina eburnea]|uniref:B3 domain-containing protein Os02g0598200-like n=1 Tax=Primulina eburnea TaxID=1245227 RepID=UPI003C6C2950
MTQNSKKSLLPDVTRFFKPMFGEGYSEYLYLPPQMGKTLKHMVDQESHLQDATGKTWPITISYVNGVLAFHKGWDEFFLQHDLSIGEILVFEHMKGSSCFSVKIYGTHACEILDFDEEICETDEDVGEDISSQSETSEVISQGECSVGTIENDGVIRYRLTELKRTS